MLVVQLLQALLLLAFEPPVLQPEARQLAGRRDRAIELLLHFQPQLHLLLLALLKLALDVAVGCGSNACRKHYARHGGAFAQHWS